MVGERVKVAGQDIMDTGTDIGMVNTVTRLDTNTVSMVSRLDTSMGTKALRVDIDSTKASSSSMLVMQSRLLESCSLARFWRCWIRKPFGLMNWNFVNGAAYTT